MRLRTKYLYWLGISLSLMLVSSVLAQWLPCECVRAGSTPEANPYTLRAITFAFERFVAVGDAGTVVVSTNGVNWVRQPTPTSSSLYGVATDGGKLLAVGDSGCVLTSTNGYDWQLNSAGAANNLRAVAFGNGEFVTLTYNSTLMASRDGVNWMPSTNGVPTGWMLVGLYFGGGVFVACGTGGMILTSSDGLNWAYQRVPVASTFHCGAYGNGVFVTAGWGEFGDDQVARSKDGISWATQRLNNFNALCYGGGLFVGVGATVQWSADGSTWASSYPNANLLGVAYGLGRYAAVGDSGAIFTATDPSVWTQCNLTICQIAALAYGNGVSVGISGNYGAIYSSEDGIHYISRTPQGGFLTSIVFARGLFIASGSVGPLVSADGTNWTTITVPSAGAIQAMQYGQGVWVAVSQNIVSSADGTNWLVRVPTSGYLTGLLYGNGRFVGYGWKGLIWSSPDGTNWQNCSYSTAANWGPGVTQDGLFSLFGPTGYLLPESAVVSRDGVHWFDPAKTGPLVGLQQDTSPNSVRLALAGNWNKVYTFQSSTNVAQWRDIGKVTNSAGISSLVLTNLGSPGALFFRAGAY